MKRPTHVKYFASTERSDSYRQNCQSVFYMRKIFWTE